MPDTQFLYWGSQNSINSAPQEESFRYVINNSEGESNIVFMAHLGDLTQDADPSSFQAVGKAFETLDSYDVAYSVLAGNHDVSGDDTRGSTPYLQTIGVGCKPDLRWAAAEAGMSTRDLMARMGHGDMRAALIYQRATSNADRIIADRLAKLMEEHRKKPEE